MPYLGKLITLKGVSVRHEGRAKQLFSGRFFHFSRSLRLTLSPLPPQKRIFSSLPGGQPACSASSLFSFKRPQRRQARWRKPALKAGFPTTARPH
ncbi:unnamed protein product [Ixodes persulcatus]